MGKWLSFGHIAHKLSHNSVNNDEVVTKLLQIKIKHNKNKIYSTYESHIRVVIL